jgi:GT2 family glycosyltransferase
VIPSWNGRKLLETCLPAVLGSSVTVDVVVVDNGSHDGTCAWLEEAYPQVRTIRNAHNLGFAAAVNQGIRASHTEWVALLNNDAVAQPAWLEELLEAGQSDTRVGAVASRMMFRDRPHLVSSAGIRVDASGGAWDLLLGQSTWPSGLVDVFGASGGACVYRRAMLEDIGVFEESFFAYLEDVDLAWRAQLRRWRTLFNPAAVVSHALSATGGEGSPFKRYYLARNKWRVVVRNCPGELLVRNWAAIIVYDALSVTRAVLARDAASLRGRRDCVRDMRVLLEQRRAIQSTRRATWVEIRAAMSPLESPLALQKRGRLAARLASQPPT